MKEKEVRIYHFYGILLQAFGINSNKDYLKMNNIDTHFWNYTLNTLALRYGFNCEVHLLAKQKNCTLSKSDKLKFVFHPVIDLFKNGVINRLLEKISLNFLRYLIKKNPTFFIFYSGVSVSTIPVLTILKLFNIPYAIHFHGGSLERFKYFKKFFYLRAKSIIVPTQYHKNKIHSLYRVNLEKITVIPCGINTDIYKPENGKAAQYPTLCFSGLLCDRKSFKEVIIALADVKKYFPNTLLHVAGNYNDEKYKNETEALISNLGIGNSIIFHNWVTKDKLKDIYSKSHLLMFPSKDEPLGRSLLEAMACGTPAISLFQAVGPREIIDNGKDGVLTDLNSLNKTVVDLLSDKDALEEISKNAREKVIKSYSFNQSFIKAEALYTKLVDSN